MFPENNLTTHMMSAGPGALEYPDRPFSEAGFQAALNTVAPVEHPPEDNNSLGKGYPDNDGAYPYVPPYNDNNMNHFSEGYTLEQGRSLYAKAFNKDRRQYPRTLRDLDFDGKDVKSGIYWTRYTFGVKILHMNQSISGMRHWTRNLSDPEKSVLAPSRIEACREDYNGQVE